MPAPASKIEEWESPLKSVDTTWAESHVQLGDMTPTGEELEMNNWLMFHNVLPSAGSWADKCPQRCNSIYLSYLVFCVSQNSL